MNLNPDRPISLKGVSMADNSLGWRANAHWLLPTDYESQYQAIRVLLSHQEEKEEELDQKIRELESKIKECDLETERGPIINRIFCLEHSVFLQAAHSMSALGVLAPYIESLFYNLFKNIEPYLKGGEDVPVRCKPERADAWVSARADAWDCHFYWKKGKVENNIHLGIFQLSKGTGFAEYLPNDSMPLLDALFSYRNKMFHCGFEWNDETKENFQKLKQERPWDESWFDSSKRDGEPWIFYMSESFIQKLLTLIDEILQGVGRYTAEVIRVKMNEAAKQREENEITSKGTGI